MNIEEYTLDRFNDLWLRVKKALPGRNLVKPTIEFKAKLGRGKKPPCGRAWYSKNLIEMCTTHLGINPADSINDTLPHELAHLIVAKVYPGAKPHGREWKHVMLKVFGIAGARATAAQGLYSNKEVTSKRLNIYTCRCRYKEHFLGETSHSRIQDDGHVAECKHCRAIVEYKTTLI